MGNLSLMLFISFVAPLVMALFICKDDSRTSLMFLLIGIVVCLFCGELNTIVMNALQLDVRYFTCNFSPLIEELFKALPILVFAFLCKPNKRVLLECAVLVGVGFAILENAHYLAADPEGFTIMNAVIRGCGCGVMHGICTLLVGYGMTFVYTRRKLFYTGTTALLALAVVMHSIYNTLVQSDHAFVGFILPTLVFIPLLYLLYRSDKASMTE